MFVGVLIMFGSGEDLVVLRDGRVVRWSGLGFLGEAIVMEKMTPMAEGVAERFILKANVLF